MNRSNRTPVVGLVGALLIASSALPDEPRNLPPQKDTLQAVLDRIHQHAAGEGWKQPGFKDDAIEAWLDKLVGSISKAADRPALKVPVRMKDIQPGEPTQPPQRRGTRKDLNRALFIHRDDDELRLTSADSSIVLIDGNVRLLSATNCVIIARGVVELSNSKGCVIVAGAFADVRHDGDRRNLAEGSIIVTPGWVEFGSATGSVIAALEGITAFGPGEMNGAIFVNAPELPVNPSFRGAAGAAEVGARIVRVADLPLEPLRRHPVAAKMKITGFVSMAAERPSRIGALAFAPRPAAGAPLPSPRHLALILTYDGCRYIVDAGKPILDEAGSPVAELSDWKLVCTARDVAVLSSPTADVLLRLEPTADEGGQRP